MVENLRPLSDRVLLKRIEEERTVGGIIIPDSAKEKAQYGLVVAVGAGKVTPEGVLIPMQVKKGDKVFFSKFAGVEAGNDYLIVREDEILAVKP